LTLKLWRLAYMKSNYYNSGWSPCTWQQPKWFGANRTFFWKRFGERWSGAFLEVLSLRGFLQRRSQAGINPEFLVLCGCSFQAMTFGTRQGGMKVSFRVILKACFFTHDDSFFYLYRRLYCSSSAHALHDSGIAASRIMISTECYQNTEVFSKSAIFYERWQVYVVDL
jgi:hypothetical protein